LPQKGHPVCGPNHASLWALNYALEKNNRLKGAAQKDGGSNFLSAYVRRTNMSFVRTGLPSLPSLPSLSVTGIKTEAHPSAKKARHDHPFIELGDPELLRQAERAGRWIDIAGASAITLCVCAWVAIRIAAAS
jgi:hypothetical protein